MSGGQAHAVVALGQGGGPGCAAQACWRGKAEGRVPCPASRVASSESPAGEARAMGSRRIPAAHLVAAWLQLLAQVPARRRRCCCFSTRPARAPRMDYQVGALCTRPGARLPPKLRQPAQGEARKDTRTHAPALACFSGRPSRAAAGTWLAASHSFRRKGRAGERRAAIGVRRGRRAARPGGGSGL